MQTVTQGPAIVAGYEWTANLTVSNAGAIFPSGCTHEAHFKSSESDAAALAELTTGSGITRVSDTVLQVKLTAVQTAAMSSYERVVFDLVRTDVSPAQYVGFKLFVPVIIPATAA